MLLPRDPELDKISPEEDPRKELVDRLLEHERFKKRRRNAASEAGDGRSGVVESADRAVSGRGRRTPGLAVTLFDLVKTFQDRAGARQEPAGLRNRQRKKSSRAGYDPIPAQPMFANDGTAANVVSARDLFERQRSRRAMICLFLALLELVKPPGRRADPEGRLRRDRIEDASKGFETVFAPGRVTRVRSKQDIPKSKWNHNEVRN